MFKRREKRNYLQIVVNAVYPPGGWRRAASYIGYRLRRLPGTPPRIARGIAAGVFVSFSPLFGFHFVYAGLIALVLRGNLLAAMLSTFVGNPITFPFIAAISLGIGEWLLATEAAVPISRIFAAFSQAFGQLGSNLISILTGGDPQWDRLAVFFKGVFLPYLIGGIAPGLVAGTAAFYLSRPVIEAYQKRRAKALANRSRREAGSKANQST